MPDEKKINYRHAPSGRRKLTLRDGALDQRRTRIGLAKHGWLQITRPPEKIALMRTITAAMDPAGILNAGKVLG